MQSEIKTYNLITVCDITIVTYLLSDEDIEKKRIGRTKFFVKHYEFHNVAYAEMIMAEHHVGQITPAYFCAGEDEYLCCAVDGEMRINTYEYDAKEYLLYDPYKPVKEKQVIKRMADCRDIKPLDYYIECEKKRKETGLGKNTINIKREEDGNGDQKSLGDAEQTDI